MHRYVCIVIWICDKSFPMAECYVHSVFVYTNIKFVTLALAWTVYILSNEKNEDY